MEANVPMKIIEKKILLIRGRKVMLSTHLAKLYGVQTRVLNQAVKRKIDRFPDDFMFHLDSAEAERLVSQNVIPHKKYFGGALPYAFTEQGIAMLSSVLNSDLAVQANNAIMRVFVGLRQMLSTNRELARKMKQLERKIQNHDGDIRVIFEAIHQSMTPTEVRKRKLGLGRDKVK